MSEQVMRDYLEEAVGEELEYLTRVLESTPITR